MSQQTVIEPCEKRLGLLRCDQHALVLGGAGSGKTTLALMKAQKVIQSTLASHQSILFLSFSRSAITRLMEASVGVIDKESCKSLSIQTLHSFFWGIIQSHAYLLGTPKKLKILLPHDERALSNGLKETDHLWAEWITTREKLCREEGRVAFDMFAPLAVELLEKSGQLRQLLSQRHPLIIVDEAQDTNPLAWRSVELLADTSTIICLADLEQQIFDHLPGIGPERVDAIRSKLQPFEIDLGSENNRSPTTEISLFASLVRVAKSGGPFIGVSSLGFHWKQPYGARTIRMAIGIITRKIMAATGDWPKSIAILLPSGSSTAKLSAAMSSWEKPIKHKLLFDEAEAMLAARFAAFLLEPRCPDQLSQELSEALELLAQLKRSRGLKEADKFHEWSRKAMQGLSLRAKTVVACKHVLEVLGKTKLTGDPVRDWLCVKNLLRDTNEQTLVEVVRHLELVVAFNRGKRIAADLTLSWQLNGRYLNARQTLENALARDQMIGGVDDKIRIQVMTIHKSKGKQFDGVILIREARSNGRTMESSFVWRDDRVPYRRSRKILSVGITRARFHTLILQPQWPTCPILSVFSL